MEYSPYITWFEKTATERPSFKALDRDVDCDICIIGGAFTGITAALYGAEKGQSVVLIEPSRIGYGCTGRNGGLIGGGLNATLDDLADFLGRLNAHDFWKSSIDARGNIAKIIKRYNIDCDYSQGLTRVSLDASKAQESYEFATYFTGLFEDEYIDFLDAESTKEIINMPKVRSAIRYVNGGVFNPLSYLFGMANAAVKNKAKIFENSPVESISEGDEIVVRTKNGTVRCKNLIVCGNAYMGEENSPEQTRTVSTDYFQLVSKPLDEELLNSISPERETIAGRRDLASYIQFTDDNRLIFGGPDFKGVKNPDKFAQKQIKVLQKLIPALKGAIEADYLWHGPVGVPMNFVPIFTKVYNNHYVAHGFNGHGVPISCYGGHVLIDALLGDDSLFDIYARIRPIKLPTFAHHAIAKLTLIYYRFGDKPFYK